MTYIPGKYITTQTLMTHMHGLQTECKLKMGNVRCVKKVIQTTFVDVCDVVVGLRHFFFLCIMTF